MKKIHTCKQRTQQEASDDISKASNGKLKLISEYKGSGNKVELLCVDCNHIFSREFKYVLKQGKCPKCLSKIKRAPKTRMNAELFVQRARQAHGDAYDYSEVVYESMHKIVSIICKEHGVFLQNPNNHIRGQQCPKCCRISSPLTHSLEYFIEKSTKAHDGFYSYEKAIYKSCKDKLIVTCPKHGDFEITPDNHSRGKGCPDCNKSKGELSIAYTLDSLGIEYIKQYRIPDCKADRPLPFDFYLPKYNATIEFQGIQHYIPVHYWGGDKGFEGIKNRDNIKREYCASNDIPLLCISYADQYNIDTIVKEWVATLRS